MHELIQAIKRTMENIALEMINEEVFSVTYLINYFLDYQEKRMKISPLKIPKFWTKSSHSN